MIIKPSNAFCRLNLHWGDMPENDMRKFHPMRSSMRKVPLLLATTMVSIETIASLAMASDKATAQTFNDFLSDPGFKSHAKTFQSNVSKDWQSVGFYSGKNKTPAPSLVSSVLLQS